MTSTLKFIKLAALFFAAIFFIASCTKDNEEDLFGDMECESTENISLQQNILPILQNNCFGCHASSVANGGVDLEDYDKLKNVALEGRLSGALNHKDGYAMMPPSGQKLDECDLLMIDTWISEGANNN